MEIISFLSIKYYLVASIVPSSPPPQKKKNRKNPFTNVELLSFKISLI